MKRGFYWYKREPRAILDAIRAGHDGRKMTCRQAIVYNIVLDLIYMGAGETPDDPQHVASHLDDLGTRGARVAIQELIDMGKLYRRDGKLSQKRAENEVKSQRNLSEIRAKSGRFGGVSSGISRREARKTNDLTEASASSKREADIDIEIEIEREVVGATAPTTAPQGAASGGTVVPFPEGLLTKVMAACKLNPNDLNSTWWMPHVAERELQRWLDLGLTEEEILRVVSDHTARYAEPPSGPRAFNRSMERLAGLKTAEPLKPKEHGYGRPPKPTLDDHLDALKARLSRERLT